MTNQKSNKSSKKKKQNNKQNKQKWLTYFFGFLAIAGVLILIYSIVKPHIEDEQRTKKVDEYQNEHKEKTKDFKQLSQHEKPIKKKDDVIGYIKVDSVDIKEPVFNGPATKEQLDKGVSIAEDKEYLDDQNISIAGHTDTVKDNFQFSNLKNIKKDAKIDLSIQGYKAKYKVINKQDVSPHDIGVMSNQKNDKQKLTLITCDDYNETTGNWDKRKIITAEKVE